MVLTIAAAGILQLHTSVVSSLRSSEAMSTAMDIARQRVQDYVGRQSAGVPTSCAYSIPALHARAGCANSNGTGPQVPASGTPGCTDEVNGADVGELAITTDIDPTARFRVDTVAVPNLTTNADDNDLMLLVSVCWQDGGRYREVQHRAVVPSPR